MPYWAVARAVPRHDRLTAECVGLAEFETFIPKVRVKVGSQWRTTPLFAGYLFVRIIDQWRALERTMGVLNVVKVGVTPSRCADAEIAKLLDRADPDGVIRLNARPRASSRSLFTPGAQVSISGGPFAGFSGLYAGQTARERELILINILGATRPVAVAAGLVVPAQ